MLMLMLSPYVICHRRQVTKTSAILRLWDDDDDADGRRPRAIQSHLDLALSLLTQSIRGCLVQFPNPIQIPKFSSIQIPIFKYNTNTNFQKEYKYKFPNPIQIQIFKSNTNTNIFTNSNTNLKIQYKYQCSYQYKYQIQTIQIPIFSPI